VKRAEPSHWSKVRDTVRVRLSSPNPAVESLCPLPFAAVGSTWTSISTSTSCNTLQSSSEVYPRYEEMLAKVSTLHTSGKPESKIYRYFRSAASPRERSRVTHVSAGHPASQEGKAPLTLFSFARPSKLEQPHHAQIDIPRHGSSCTADVQADSRELLKI
jgi:hypothetical protein